MKTTKLRINLDKHSKFTTNFFQQKLQILIDLDFENSKEVNSIILGSNIIEAFCIANQLTDIQRNIKNIFELEKPRVEDLLAIAKFHGYNLVEQAEPVEQAEQPSSISEAKAEELFSCICESRNPSFAPFDTGNGVLFMLSNTADSNVHLMDLNSINDLYNADMLTMAIKNDDGLRNGEPYLPLVNLKLNELTKDKLNYLIRRFNRSDLLGIFKEEITILEESEWRTLDEGKAESKDLIGLNISGFHLGNIGGNPHDKPNWKGPFKTLDVLDEYESLVKGYELEFESGEISVDKYFSLVGTLDSNYKVNA